MTPLPRGVRFAAALAILGVVMFVAPPRAAVYLGIVLVLGALVSSKADAAGPIKAFGELLYGK
jgi:hypothetical protein